MNDQPPEPPENPAVGDLESLLSDVRAAVDRTPTLSGPFSNIAGGDNAWTGSQAERVARDHLDPLATELSSALTRLEEVVQEKLDATPAHLDDTGQPAPTMV